MSPRRQNVWGGMTVPVTITVLVLLWFFFPRIVLWLA